MDVILLERMPNLGQMGDTVRVRDGFARNFLLPRGKALRATEGNKKRFETQRVELEARNLKQRGEAEKVGKKVDGRKLHRHPTSGRIRPALRIGVDARHRRGRCGRRVQGQRAIRSS